MTTDGRRARGDLTRRRAARQAAMDATLVGLDGVTVGRLAATTGLSKSGILTVFGTREALQLAAVDEARAIYLSETIEPARTAEAGLARLRALLVAWRDYAHRGVFPGGCFVVTTSAEFGSRQGAVADAVRQLKADWLGYLAHHFRLAGSSTPQDDAFRVDALLTAGMMQARLFDDAAHIDRAVDFAADVVDRAVTPQTDAPGRTA